MIHVRQHLLPAFFVKHYLPICVRNVRILHIGKLEGMFPIQLSCRPHPTDNAELLHFNPDPKETMDRLVGGFPFFIIEA